MHSNPAAAREIRFFGCEMGPKFGRFGGEVPSETLVQEREGRQALSADKVPEPALSESGVTVGPCAPLQKKTKTQSRP